jgi:hypothetical protein
MPMRRIVTSIVFVGLAIGVSGCWGVKKVEVKGRVTYNGTPLAKPGGKIVFVAPDGSQVAAPIEQDGAYLAVGVPAGPNQVAVSYPNPEFKAGKRLPGKKGGDVTAPAATPFLMPEKYASVETSGLSVQVDTGTIFDAPLTGPAIP